MKRLCRWISAASAFLLPAAMMLTALFNPGTAWANGGPSGHPGGYYGYHMGGHGLFGPLTLILVIAAIVVIVVLVMRGSGTGANASPRHAKPPKSAQDILKQRYARGDITTKEFQERLKVLEESD